MIAWAYRVLMPSCSPPVTSWIGFLVPAGGVTARNAKSRFGSLDCCQPAATVIVFTVHAPYGLMPWCHCGT